MSSAELNVHKFKTLMYLGEKNNEIRKLRLILLLKVRDKLLKYSKLLTLDKDKKEKITSMEITDLVAPLNKCMLEKKL